jgi:hypothetical protein
MKRSTADNDEPDSILVAFITHTASAKQARDLMMTSTIEFVDSNGLGINHHLYSVAHSSYSKLEELAGEYLSKLQLSVKKSRSSFGHPQYSSTPPWLECSLGNNNLTDSSRDHWRRYFRQVLVLWLVIEREVDV